MLMTPVVVILGCTGTGKSKLAIELAKQFNGEIISADSMQVYKGLDIITNKVTPQEQRKATHHFISCVDPLSRYTVVDFRFRALPLIDQLLKEEKMPIIVGGTNYYIESLLWDVLINPEAKFKNLEEKLLFDFESRPESMSSTRINEDSFEIDLLKREITQSSVDGVPNSVLHQALQEVDPPMADALHPQDRRKVIRSLQVYQQHGCRHSELLLNQRCQDGGSSLGGPLRYKNSIMLWLQCDKEVLEKRLDDRVDQMIQNGLINELLDFHKCYNEKRITSRSAYYTEGIFQSIGFKEFHKYLTLSEDERNTEKGEKIFKKGIEDMKMITKKYAKKQVKWIVNRFLRKPDRQLPPVYGLDATNIDLWNENVLQPSTAIIHSLSQCIMPTQSPLPVEEGPKDIQETHYCEVCERIFVGRKTWEIHLNSKKHHKRKASIMKKNNQKQENFQSV